MSGAMLAVVGSGQNIVYSAGLVRKLYNGYAGTNVNAFDSATPYSTTIDTAPASQSWSGSPGYTGIWTGYYRAPATGTAFFNINVSLSDCNNYNFFWIGPDAKTTYSAGNANYLGYGSGSTNIPVSAGWYYPIRIQISYDGDGGFFDDPYIDFTLLVDSSTSYGVFYNTLTQGF